MRLEDHLFVELADAHRFAFSEREEHAVESAVRNRTCVENREACCAITRCHYIAHAVPGQSWPQLAKLVRGIAAAQQVEHALEGGARKRSEWRRAPHEVKQKINLDLRSSGVCGVGGVSGVIAFQILEAEYRSSRFLAPCLLV